ncbi:hypothetical protein [Edwardsiella tarda]|uniref:hypothetical protein n=1 Tax=Edwardsiella tarda TaxID=636 RepID=UPI00030D1BC3|nr:hypothetical protein [Edwardsiella tarda]
MNQLNEAVLAANSHEQLADILSKLPLNASGNPPTGRTSFVVTARGDEVETAFAVVEASNLTPSNDTDGRINPNYPQELQPRDRTRKASKVQVATMANALRPAQLTDSGLSSHGAPIVGDDLVVESGNGRTMAITKAYAEGKAADYKAYLIKNAGRFGLSSATIDAMTAPVLVRIRKSQVDRVAFAKDSNLSDMTEMAPAEKAWVDAENIDQNMMSVFSPGVGGNLLAKSNTQFMQAFMRSLGNSAAAGMLTADGRPTKQLVDRMQNAIFAKAYKNDKLVKMMAEEPDPDIRNVLTALNAAAPEFVDMQYLSGEIHKQTSDAVVDAVDSLDKEALSAIVEATELVRSAKDSGQSVAEYIRQLGLFGNVSEHAEQLALFIATNQRSAKRMGEAFTLLAKEINAELQHGAAAAGDMFGGGQVSLSDIIQRVEMQLDLDISGQTAMFEAKGSTAGQDVTQLMGRLISAASSHDELSSIVKMALLSQADLLYAWQSNGFSYNVPIARLLVTSYTTTLQVAMQSGDVNAVKQMQKDIADLGGILSTSAAKMIMGSAVSKVAGYRCTGNQLNDVLKTLQIPGMMSECGQLYLRLQDESISMEERFMTAAKLGRIVMELPRERSGAVTAGGTLALHIISKAHGVTDLQAMVQAYHGQNIDLPSIDMSTGSQVMSDCLSKGHDVCNQVRFNANPENVRGLLLLHPKEAAREQAAMVSAAGFTKKDSALLNDELTKIFQITGSKPSLLVEVSNQKGTGARAFACRHSGQVKISASVLREQPDVLWHEVGHHIEYAYPKIKAAAIAFLKHRGANCPIKPLKTLYPNAKYRTEEIAVEDGFESHYTSKVYTKRTEQALSDGLNDTHIESTEIISNGLQYLGQEMFFPHKRGFGADVEFRNFIVGIFQSLGKGEYENLGF